MKVLGIVPARGGSKRLPRKNLLPLGGKPLVAWAIEAALKAERIDRVVVSSDDAEILACASLYRSAVPIERPRELAQDESPAIEYVRHALSVMGEFDAVAIVQPTSPFTLPADIDATITLLESSGADSAVTVMKLDHAIHPAKLKVMRGDLLMPYLEEEQGRMAAHELPDLYVRNCSVYAVPMRTLEKGQIIGHDCRGHLMPRERSLDINDATDFAFAEFLLARSR